MNIEELNVMMRIVNTVRSNTPVLVFCDSNIPFIQRMIAVITDVDYAKIKTGNLNEEEWKQIDDRTPILENAPLYICDKEIDTAEGYIKEIEDSQLNVEYVFIDVLPDNIDKEKLINWSKTKGISLEFTDFDDTLR